VYSRVESLPELVVVEPTVFGDHRGAFFESYNRRGFAEATGWDVDFVQDNHSRSTLGVLRGLHFQNPTAQGKLVRVVVGAVWDVAVDLRRSSSTFGGWFGLELTAENHRQLWVPPGFGHGYATLSSVADLLYKTTDYWAPDHERAVRWDDPDIGIGWPIDGPPILSDKDAAAPLLADAHLFD
jgi:dTDP-4-dehydrorhamnose 3,5-epimerase